MEKDIEYSYNSKKKRLRTLVNGLVIKESTGSYAKKQFARLVENKPTTLKKE